MRKLVLAVMLVGPALMPGKVQSDEPGGRPPPIWLEYVRFEGDPDDTFAGAFWNPTHTVLSQFMRVRANVQGLPNTVYQVRFSACADSEGPFTTLTTSTAPATDGTIGRSNVAMMAYSWENEVGCISNLPLCEYGWWVQIELIRGGVVKDTQQVWMEPVYN